MGRCSRTRRSTTRPLRNRDDVIERMQLQFLDARDAKAPRPWIDATRQEVDARYELWKVNERHLDLIVEAMPVGDGLRFRRMALEQMYPDIYETHRFEHAVTFVQENVSLTESQEAGLSDLLWSYQDELEPLCEERVRIVHKWDPGRLISNTQDSVGMSCYKFMESMDLAHLEWLEKNNAARDARFDLDREYLKRLESLLTPKVFAALPQHALRAGHGDFRRGPVPGVDPRDMGVVYMKSPGEPIKKASP